jgi:hypothetical protein
MAIFKNSLPIVRDGMVLCLDAANTKSYVSGSTIWNDVSGGGNNGTLTNGPTFNSGGGGGILLDGVNDFVAIASSDAWRLATSSTVMIWCNPVNNSGNIICFQKDSWQGWIFQANSAVIYSGQAGANDLNGSFGTLSYGSWQQLVLVVNRETAQYILYRNGVSVSTSSITQTPIPSNAILYLGTRGSVGDQYANVNISNLQIYNRALSAQEVLQNFNVMKSRFNLL